MIGKGSGAVVLLLISSAVGAVQVGEELTPTQRRAIHQELKGLNERTSALLRQGKYAEAVDVVERVVTLYRRLFPGPGHPYLATSLNNLGVARLGRGDLNGAEKVLREALAMHRRLSPDVDQRELANCLDNLGSALRDQGNPAEAEPYQREALALHRRLSPKGHPDLVIALTNLGRSLVGRRDLVGAESCFREAVELGRRLDRDAARPRLASALASLGALLQERGDLAGAEGLFREALALDRRLHPADHPDLASGLNNLGWLLRQRGDLGGAEKYLSESLAMRRRLHPGADHPDLASTLNNLSLVFWARRDPDRAEKLAREVLALRRRLYRGADHPDLANTLQNLGALLHARGERAGAERYVREALAMRQRFLFRQAGVLAEAEALDLAGSVRPARDHLLSLTRGRPDDPDIYGLLWGGRSAVTRLLEQRRRDLLAGHDPDARALADELLGARLRLARLLLAPAEEQARRGEAIRSLTETKEGLEKRLARRLRLAAPAELAAPPPPAELAAALAADAAFLDFYRYDTVAPDPGGKPGPNRAARYAVFLVERGRPAARVELGEAAPLEAAWAAWHQAITGRAPPARERQAAAALARLVWEPIRRRVSAGVATLYLAPDGALTQVPFAALPGTKPGTVLLEDFAFATVPHGPFLLERLAQKSGPPVRGALLAVGAVAYAAPDGPGAAVLWRPLPGTRRELERAVALAKKLAGLEARPLSGEAATVERALKELPRARYAHLATHGYFAGPAATSAFAGNPEPFRLTDRRGGARSPLVLSGLVFAGANRTGAAAAADRGILTAEAVVGLRLDGMELAVLSACNSGLGEVGGGEGVYGLQRAFHLAGCKDVVASLWAVDDDATAALMALFYRNLWDRKLDPLQALRQAQLELYRHPRQVKEIVTRADDWTPRPLPAVDPDAAGSRARTAQWAAFTFSGAAALGPREERSGP